MAVFANRSKKCEAPGLELLTRQDSQASRPEAVRYDHGRRDLDASL